MTEEEHPTTINVARLKGLIEAELAEVQDPRVVAHIRKILIEPHVVNLGWDYGEPEQTYPCWIVLDDRSNSRAEIAYCEYGFGPSFPWGLVSSNPSDSRMGMDCGWFPTFMEAFFDSLAATKLPIWKVVKRTGEGASIALTDEGAWDVTWEQIMHLRTIDPTTRYHCEHSIAYRKVDF